MLDHMIAEPKSARIFVPTYLGPIQGPLPNAKKKVFFIKLDEKFVNLKEKFLKLDTVFLYIVLHCERCELM